MDIEQLAKKLEWLDEERRKDKQTIASLQKSLADLEEQQPAQLQRIQALENELSRFATSLLRFEQIEAAMGQMRVELARMIQEIDKQAADRDREQDKIRLTEMETIQKSIGDLRKSVDTLPEIRKALQARVDGELSLGRELDELRQTITVNQRSDEEYRRQIKMVEESTRQDAKRLADLQGEVSALRKRVEEQRGKWDLVNEAMRKVDLRVNELHAAESERRQAQVAFMEKQNMAAMEREKVWKEWQRRFEQIEAVSANLDVQVQSLDATHRAVKRAQEGFEEITARFERRINEITEMQRLVEDRFRQEWVSYRADDQKRWANYTLAQEEQQREISRQINRVEERLVFLEDLTQEIQDQAHTLNEELSKRLQSLAVLTRDWVEEHSKNLQNSR
jgi:chromosome segregation ATPase